jgi:hypothetical protein
MTSGEAAGSGLMRQRNQRSAQPLAAILLLGLALALGGCMRVQRTFTINSDGSGVYVLKVGFHQPKPGDPTSVPTNVTTPMEAFGAHVQQSGGTYQRDDESDYTYWTYMRPFASVSQAEALLQEDPHQYDDKHTPLLYHDSLSVSDQAGLLRPSTIHVTGTISLVDLTGNAKKDWSDATESMTITMPNGVSAHQGGTLDGNSVTYTIAYNESAKIDVQGPATTTNGAGTLALVVVVGIALLALALAALGIRLIRGSMR